MSPNIGKWTILSLSLTGQDERFIPRCSLRSTSGFFRYLIISSSITFPVVSASSKPTKGVWPTKTAGTP
jgi:hypothetical protein